MKDKDKKWNIWGGFLISLVVSWLTHFDKSIMDGLASYLALSLVVIGMLTFAKSVIKEKEGKEVKEKHLVLGEEIAKNLYEEMKEGKKMEKTKKFFKWLWGNKLTLINLIISVSCVALVNFMNFCGYMNRFSIYQENETVFKIIIAFGGFGYLVIDIFTTCSKYGCESLEQLNTRYEKAKNDKLNALTSEQKKIVKESLSKLEKTYNELKTKLANAVNTIESYKIFSNIEGFNLNSLTEGYNQAINFVNANQANLNELEKQVAILKAKLK